MTARHSSTRTARAGAGLAALALALAPALAGCSSGSGTKDDGAQRAADALAAGLTKGAVPVGVQGGSAASARAGLRTATSGMAGATRTVTVDKVTVTGSKAAVGLRWSWTLPGSTATWSYLAPATLIERHGAWRLRWAPSVVQPSLSGDEALQLHTLPATRGDILGAGGVRLVKDRPVLRLGIDKTKLSQATAARSAGSLAALVGVDAHDFVRAVKAAGPKAFVEAIVFRTHDVPPDVTAHYAAIPGARAVADQMPLAPTKAFAHAILGSVGPVTAEMLSAKGSPYVAGDEAGLSGLEQRYDARLRGTPGVQVDANSEDGPERTLFTRKATDGSDLRTTLDPALQRQADAALAAVGPASALVAIRPSTGSILAVASGPGSEGYDTATFGEYAPGSTFKIVTSLALLRSGLTPSSTVHCTPTLDVDGKPFKNYSDYPPSEVGTIALRTAFANSCNTAFISGRHRVGAADLQSAGAALGVGVDHDLGFPAYFGSVPSAGSATEHAASMIGQGKVLMSPMAMATVVASVVHGAAVLPRLLAGHTATAAAPAQPLTAGEADRLRSMMRSVVTEGSGVLLDGLPGPPVIAKTGTAEFGTGTPLPTHAWMVAGQGDLAVAVFVDRGDTGSGTAGPILERFLRAARR